MKKKTIELKLFSINKAEDYWKETDNKKRDTEPKKKICFVNMKMLAVKYNLGATRPSIADTSCCL